MRPQSCNGWTKETALRRASVEEGGVDGGALGRGAQRLARTDGVLRDDGGGEDEPVAAADLGAGDVDALRSGPQPRRRRAKPATTT